MKILEKAIETYGKDMQLTVAVEEFSELIKEICKNIRGSDNVERITEEMADCYIMMDQLAIIFGIKNCDINAFIDEKLARLEKRMAEREKAPGDNREDIWNKNLDRLMNGEFGNTTQKYLGSVPKRLQGIGERRRKPTIPERMIILTTSCLVSRRGMMSFKEVSARKFDALMTKRLELKKCPRCPNYGAEIIISMTAYGPKVHRVFVKCKYCGYEAKAFDASTHLRDAETGRIGTFVLNPSMARAIHSAVNDWNGREKNA